MAQRDATGLVHPVNALLDSMVACALAGGEAGDEAEQAIVSAGALAAADRNRGGVTAAIGLLGRRGDKVLAYRESFFASNGH